MLIIDEKKLSYGTIAQIGREYGILKEVTYSPELVDYEAYVKLVVDYLKMLNLANLKVWLEKAEEQIHEME